MMGRAGRPQYDKQGVAVIMVHEPKKAFYKKFLYEPFPVESSLPENVCYASRGFFCVSFSKVRCKDIKFYDFVLVCVHS